MIYIREFIAGLISPYVVLSRVRLSQQLLRFSFTELYTSFDIDAVAERQQGGLREEMKLHASDELRHHRIFKEWASKIEPYVSANYGDPGDVSGLDVNSVRASAQLPAAPNRRLPALGDYMLYIFLSESRAVLQFQLYSWINRYDRGCVHTIPALLKDERRHVSYSLKYAWIEFKKAPGKRFFGSLRVLGYILRQDIIDLGKLIQTVGSGVMGHLLYYIFVTPYGLLLRLAGSTKRALLRSPRKAREVSLDAKFWQEL